jgi:hypothetical protein
VNQVIDLNQAIEDKRWEVKDWYMKLHMFGHEVDVSGKYSLRDGEYKAYHIDTVFIHGAPEFQVMTRVRDRVDKYLGELMG